MQLDVQNRRTQAGFSLVELAIVLVILGLLTGGVLSGQSLIRAAELRSITNDFQRYTAAVRTFRDKYFALPGDMSNATRFWNTGTCPGNNTNTSAVMTATCDGNGNGQLSPSVAASNENYRFWQHLSNAGIIEGGFLGISASATASTMVSSTADLTQNVPRSRIQQAGWTPFYVGSPLINTGANATLAATTFFEGTWDHVFLFGTTTTADATTGALLKPEEAWNIDTKLDDGRPGIGLVSTLENQAGADAENGCSDTASAVTAIAAASSYSLRNAATACSLIFKMGI